MTSAILRTTRRCDVCVSSPSTSFQTATFSGELLADWRHFVDRRLRIVVLSLPELSDSVRLTHCYLTRVVRVPPWCGRGEGWGVNRQIFGALLSTKTCKEHISWSRWRDLGKYGSEVTSQVPADIACDYFRAY